MEREVLREDKEAKHVHKISSVPYFLIDNRLVLNGSQVGIKSIKEKRACVIVVIIRWMLEGRLLTSWTFYVVSLITTNPLGG